MTTRLTVLKTNLVITCQRAKITTSEDRISIKTKTSRRADICEKLLEVAKESTVEAFLFSIV